jgi:molecular chaperone GrpE
MSGETTPRPRVRVSDKRIKSSAPEAAHSDAASDVVPENAANAVTEPAHDYLDDLRRLQAEFDNYRKRMMREQTEIAGRASARLIERLLVVLDNFDRALAHHADHNGLDLVHKELMAVLSTEGLERIDAIGKPFDPTLHEAVESHEEEGVTQPTCTDVYRTGYLLKGKVLRPSMVVVARPSESVTSEASDEADEGE